MERTGDTEFVGGAVLAHGKRERGVVPEVDRGGILLGTDAERAVDMRAGVGVDGTGGNRGNARLGRSGHSEVETVRVYVLLRVGNPVRSGANAADAADGGSTVDLDHAPARGAAVRAVVGKKRSLADIGVSALIGDTAAIGRRTAEAHDAGAQLLDASTGVPGGYIVPATDNRTTARKHTGPPSCGIGA